MIGHFYRCLDLTAEDAAFLTCDFTPILTQPSKQHIHQTLTNTIKLSRRLAQLQAPTMSLWNPDNIRDVAESVGINSLNDDVVENLSRDVEYRISQVLEEALKFMRHGKRTLLTTQDVSNALRVLDVEPLYGYESARPLRFGEATIGPGQPLFYVEDDEVDFEKLINAPLPKVPREISFTGMHAAGLALTWIATYVLTME